jgi:hypothetical protein
MLNKLLSGRWLFTVAAALVFLILSVNKVLPVDKVTEIVLVVVMAYFGRPDRTQNGGAK